MIDDINAGYPFSELAIVKTGEIENMLFAQNADYTFIGHEHKPFAIDKDNKHIIDVGSSGCTKDNKTHYIILSIKEEISIVRKDIIFDRKRLVENINKINYPERKFLAKIFFGVEI